MVRNPHSYKGTARQVSELLKSRSSGLGKLLDQARQLQFLDQKLADLLEPEIGSQVQVAALRENCLVLVTPSAALATRLKHDSDSLLNSLQASGVKGISQIRVRTAPLSQTKPVARRKRKLPDIARQSLERFAADSGDDDILDLLRRGRRRDERQ